MDLLSAPTTLSSQSPLIASSSSTLTTRPVTSKARGICKYYTDPRGCYAKDKCKFLHAEPSKEGEEPILTPYDRSKKCKFYAQGYCKRGDQCWFLHVDTKGKGTLDEEDDLCSICFETPTTYGLLAGCSHIFCITCIKQWRDASRKAAGVVESGNTKRCPMCRAPSRFITPSSKFWHDGPEKDKTIEAYRESMSKVQCRYFQKSLARPTLMCPFGNECFYQHKKPDGTMHEFADGAEVSMRRYRSSLLLPFNRRFFPMFDVTNLAFTAGLDLDGGWFGLPPNGNTNAEAANPPQRENGVTEGEAMAVAFDMLRNHLRESTGAAASANAASGPNDRGQAGTDLPPGAHGEAYMMMRLLDVVRDQLLPNLRSATGANTPPVNRPPRNSTRNGTATVADDADDEPPPPLEPIPRAPGRSGYESDDSMPGLRSVSNSSDSEDEPDNDNDDLDNGPRATLDPTELFRHLFDMAEIPNPTAEVRTSESRPASSARFSTVVDRSSTNASTPGGAAGTPATGTPMEYPIPLSLEWVRSVLRMDMEDDHQSDDDEEEMPPLEPAVRTVDDMPPLEPIPDDDLPSLSLVEITSDVSRPRDSERQQEVDGDGDHPPPLEPFESSSSLDISSNQPSMNATLARVADTPVPCTRNEQEFTTDGRGRVISIGGPEPPTLSRSQLQSETQIDADDVLESGEQDGVVCKAPPVQRQASEFTTDGRGRVISVGDSVDTGSSTTNADTREGADGSRSESDASGERGNEESGNGRGLFAWFNALF